MAAVRRVVLALLPTMASLAAPITARITHRVRRTSRWLAPAAAVLTMAALTALGVGVQLLALVGPLKYIW